MQHKTNTYTHTHTGRPFPIQNCTISNQTSDSFSIDCIEGFDGGLPQVFLLEVVEVPTLRLLRNLTLLVNISVPFICLNLILITQNVLVVNTETTNLILH